jgi:hypothetical protein
LYLLFLFHFVRDGVGGETKKEQMLCVQGWNAIANIELGPMDRHERLARWGEEDNGFHYGFFVQARSEQTDTRRNGYSEVGTGALLLHNLCSGAFRAEMEVWACVT